MKLNLGCGPNKSVGYVNVDIFGDPDVKWDLNKTPWPWDDNSVEEIQMSHILEHLGEDTETFLKIMQELYRVCKNEAIIDITVPNPLTDTYFADPTHVRPILPLTIGLFSKKLNDKWAEDRSSNTPLAYQCDVDFEIIETEGLISPEYAILMETHPNLNEHASKHVNIISQYSMKVKVIK